MNRDVSQQSFQKDNSVFTSQWDLQNMAIWRIWTTVIKVINMLAASMPTLYCSDLISPSVFFSFKRHLPQDKARPFSSPSTIIYFQIILSCALMNISSDAAYNRLDLDSHSPWYKHPCSWNRISPPLPSAAAQNALALEILFLEERRHQGP